MGFLWYICYKLSKKKANTHAHAEKKNTTNPGALFIAVKRQREKIKYKMAF